MRAWGCQTGRCRFFFLVGIVECAESVRRIDLSLQRLESGVPGEWHCEQRVPHHAQPKKSLGKLITRRRSCTASSLSPAQARTVATAAMFPGPVMASRSYAHQFQAHVVPAPPRSSYHQRTARHGP